MDEILEHSEASNDTEEFIVLKEGSNLFGLCIEVTMNDFVLRRPL